MNMAPSSLTIPSLLDTQAEKYGDRDAVVGEGGRLSYNALRQAARQAAKGLLAIGVKRGDHVAILMDNRPEWIVSFLAVQQLGATAVGVNTWATPREMEYTLAHAEVKVLIAVGNFRKNDYSVMIDGMRPLAKTFPQLHHIVWFGSDGKKPAASGGEISWQAFLAEGKQISDEQVDAAALAVTGDDVALMVYTSGSTAMPKGILLQQRLWIQNGWNIGERQHATEKDRLWLAVSLFWSFGCANALPNILTHGACVVLQTHFDPAEALALIETERCSLIYGTPNMAQALIEHPSRAGRDLSSLRSGAMIGTPEQLMTAVHLGARNICNIYGLSETYGNCAVIDADEPLEIRLQSVGKPLPGVTIRIADMETGALLPAGEVGEIRVLGPLFLAYYKEPEKTRETYDENGFFRTGDLGMLDEEGRLYYRGRLKEMVKTGGINVAPIEVEEVLMRHPAVRTAYVVGLPDPVLDEKLAAVIILKDGATFSSEDLKAFCKREMAAYKVPALYRLTRDDELPLTTTGKIQKMKLHALFENQKQSQ